MPQGCFALRPSVVLITVGKFPFGTNKVKHQCVVWSFLQKFLQQFTQTNFASRTQAQFKILFEFCALRCVYLEATSCHWGKGIAQQERNVKISFRDLFFLNLPSGSECNALPGLSKNMGYVEPDAQVYRLPECVHFAFPEEVHLGLDIGKHRNQKSCLEGLWFTLPPNPKYNPQLKAIAIWDGSIRHGMERRQIAESSEIGETDHL